MQQSTRGGAATNKQSTHLGKDEEEKEKFAFAFFSSRFDAATIAARKEVNATTSGEMEWKCTPPRMRAPTRRAYRSGLGAEEWAANG